MDLTYVIPLDLGDVSEDVKAISWCISDHRRRGQVQQLGGVYTTNIIANLACKKAGSFLSRASAELAVKH